MQRDSNTPKSNEAKMDIRDSLRNPQLMKSIVGANYISNDSFLGVKLFQFMVLKRQAT